MEPGDQMNYGQWPLLTKVLNAKQNQWFTWTQWELWNTMVIIKLPVYHLNRDRRLLSSQSTLHPLFCQAHAATSTTIICMNLFMWGNRQAGPPKWKYQTHLTYIIWSTPRPCWCKSQETTRSEYHFFAPHPASWFGTSFKVKSGHGEEWIELNRVNWIELN